MKRIFLVGVLFIVVFAAAYVPSQLSLRELRETSEQTRQDLEMRLRAAEERYRVAVSRRRLGNGPARCERGQLRECQTALDGFLRSIARRGSRCKRPNAEGASDRNFKSTG